MPTGYRRRRKTRWAGSEWTPNTISADSQSGVWCPRHRMRHGYKSSKLGVQYDRRTNGTWVILWTCADTGDVLKEMELNNE